MQHSRSEEDSPEIDKYRLNTAPIDINSDELSEDDNIGNRVQNYNENGEYRFGNRRQRHQPGNNRDYRPAQQQPYSKPYYRGGRQQDGQNRHRDVYNNNYNNTKGGYSNQSGSNYSQYGGTANRSRLPQHSGQQKSYGSQAGGNRQNSNGSQQHYRAANSSLDRHGNSIPYRHRSGQNIGLAGDVVSRPLYDEASKRQYKNKTDKSFSDKASVRQINAQRKDDKKNLHRPANLMKVLHRLDFASPKILMQAIRSGIIAINGQTIDNQNIAIDKQKDIISAYGRELSTKQENIYVVMNKARSIAGSNEKSSATIYQNFYYKHRWFFPIGCLDKSASGIIILTTDKRHCSPDISPIALLEKEYYCKIHKVLSAEEIVALQRFLDETLHEDTEIATIRRNTRNMIISATVTQSSPTALRSALKRFGLEIISFYRRRVGTFTTDDIPAGAWRRLAQEEVDALNEFAEFSAQRNHSVSGSKNSNADIQQEQTSVSLKEKMHSLYRQIFKS